MVHSFMYNKTVNASPNYIRHIFKKYNTMQHYLQESLQTLEAIIVKITNNKRNIEIYIKIRLLDIHPYECIRISDDKNLNIKYGVVIMI